MGAFAPLEVSLDTWEANTMDPVDEEFEAVMATLSPDARGRIERVLDEYSLSHRDITTAEALEAAIILLKIICADRKKGLDSR